MTQLDKTIQAIREIYQIKGVQAVLDWDREVCMPKKGDATRAAQTGLIAEIAHLKLTAADFGKALDDCLSDSALGEDHRILLSRMKRDRDRAVKVPVALVKEMTEECAKAHQVWATARAKNRFVDYAPTLLKIIDLKKKEAECLGVPEGGTVYDTLMDGFEMGATTKLLDPILARTRDITVDAVRAIRKSKRKPKIDIVTRKYPVEQQETLAIEAAKGMGFDFEAGRMDRAVHPFSTSLALGDVRITTRYNDRHFNDCFFSVLHEAGHGLYEQGMNPAWESTPMAEFISMGIHESNSRLWENQVGRSRAYWKHWYPRVKKLFPTALGKVKMDDFYFAINAVSPSFIRVDADEVTYNLHVIIRYEIEKALFAGEIDVNDLPRVWNEKMKEYLGIVPKKDSQGVLQDVHWSMGGFGYFPTYLLGNLYSAQWMATMKKQIRGLDASMEKGNLKPIKKWLNENIHTHGRRYTAQELVLQVTGEGLNPEYFDRYLKNKYGPLYEVEW